MNHAVGVVRPPLPNWYQAITCRQRVVNAVLGDPLPEGECSLPIPKTRLEPCPALVLIVVFQQSYGQLCNSTTISTAPPNPIRNHHGAPTWQLGSASHRGMSCSICPSCWHSWPAMVEMDPAAAGEWSRRLHWACQHGVQKAVLANGYTKGTFPPLDSDGSNSYPL